MKFLIFALSLIVFHPFILADSTQDTEQDQDVEQDQLLLNNEVNQSDLTCEFRIANDSIRVDENDSNKIEDEGHTHGLHLSCFSVKNNVTSGMIYATDLYTHYRNYTHYPKKSNHPRGSSEQPARVVPQELKVLPEPTVSEQAKVLPRPNVSQESTGSEQAKDTPRQSITSSETTVSQEPTTQDFYEVNKWQISKDNILESQDSNKIYFLITGGVGQIHNNKNSNILGAATQQEIWHELTNDSYITHYGDINKIKPLLRIGAGKTWRIDNLIDSCPCTVDRLRVEVGVDLLTLTHGTQVYIILAVDKELVKLKHSSIGMFFDAESRYNPKNDLRTTRLGGMYYENKKRNFRMAVGLVYNEGEKNNPLALPEYTDEGPILDINVIWTF